MRDDKKADFVTAVNAGERLFVGRFLKNHNSSIKG